MAVNFYKFAAAIMELLEPERFNFSSTRNRTVQTNALTQNQADGIQNAVLSDAAADSATGDGATAIFADAEQEAQTVQIVAAQLTQTIANASEEKIQQVAEVIAQVAAETKEARTADVLIETIETAKDADASAKSEAASLVAATVQTLAAETIQNIQTAEFGAPQSNSQTPTTTNEEKAAQAEIVAEALTDKLIETVDLNESSVEAAIVGSAQTETGAIGDSAQASEVVDFWDLYPEINPSDIAYSSAVAYLYVYMKSRDMLDFLNPEIALTDRQLIMTNVSEQANRQSGWEADFELKNQRAADEQTNQTRDAEHEESVKRARLNEELQQRLRVERRRFEERLRGAQTKY